MGVGLIVLIVVGALTYLCILGLNMGRLLGTKEEWSDHCDLFLRGEYYNGRKTYYVLFVPVFRTGFYHSTMMTD